MVPKICSVPECETGGYLSRGLCKMHYARLLRTGSTGSASKMHAVSWAGISCKQDGCDSPARSLGYCTAHYKRFRRYGDASIKRPTRPAAERFLESFAVAGECWEWSGVIGNHGYGIFYYEGKKRELAHRYAYQMHRGEIPEGLHIDHLCRNRKCVNPSHLEAVTPLENSSRGLRYRLLNGMDDSCIHGHKYTPENTYVEPNGYKVRCRTCARERDRQPHRNAAARRSRYTQQKAG